MTTQYTSILKLALPVQGELSGTWGDTVNDNITSMVEEAIAGRAVIDSWTANSHTLTTANGTTSESRCAMLEFTDTGAALTGNATVICPTASKIYIAKNAVGSSRTVTLKTSAGTGIAVPDGTTMFLFCDGTNVVEAVTNMNSFTVGGTVTIVAIKDEDDMVSDSATALATQQSIKAYVDSQVGSFDTLAEVLAQGNTSGGTAIQMTTTDEVQFRDTALKISSSADGQLDIDADTELEITAPTVDIDASTAVLVSNDLKLDSDDAVLGFGADNDVTLTHIPDTALRINDAIAVEFRDADLSINSSADGQLDIDADTEIEITAPTVDIDASTEVNISGATKVGGTLSVDTIAELTATAGVTVDDIIIKDNTVGTPDSSGTDVAGTNVTVKGGAGTGTGAGGSLVFQTAPAGTTGSTPNAQVTAMTIDSAGDATFTGASANMSWDKSADSLAFADNAKAVFGAGSDLQIYHDGSNSYIVNTQGSLVISDSSSGAGDMTLQTNGSELALFDSAGSKYMLRALTGGQVDLFHNGLTKLSTTATGIDVTGGITATTDITISNGNNRFVAESTSAGDYVRIYGGSGTGKWDIYGNGANLRIGDNEGLGLVQIDTDLYTVGSVGIGTSSPAYRLSVQRSGVGVAASFTDGVTDTAHIEIVSGGGCSLWAGGFLTFGAGGGGSNTERMRIDSSGNVVIGSGGLDVSGIGGTYQALNMRAGAGYPVLYGQTTATATNSPGLQLIGATSGASAGGAAELLGIIQIAAESDSSTNAAGYMNFYTGSGGSATERMRIDSSGNVGIGTASPAELLHIESGTNGEQVDIRFRGLTTSAGAGRSANIGFDPDPNDTGTSSEAQLYLSADTTNKTLVATASGNVGIGTDSPLADLHLSSTSNTNIMISDSDAGADAKNWDIRVDGNNFTLNHINDANDASNTWLTAVRSGYTTDHISFHTGSGTEAMRITSSGNLLVGLTSGQAAQIHVQAPKTTYTDYATVFAGGTDSNNGQHSISLMASGNGLGGLVGSNVSIDGATFTQPVIARSSGYFSFTNGTTAGKTSALAYTGFAKGTTTPIERFRVDEDGNLLVGTTDTTPWDNSTATSADDGIFLGGGRLGLAKWGGVPLLVNRTDSDGDIAIFYKDGAPVGSIGTNTGILYIGSGEGTDAYLGFGNDIIRPVTSAGASRDNAIDLGYVGMKFKDVHAGGRGFFNLYSAGINSGNIMVGEGVYVGAANGDNQIRSSSAGGGSATLYIGNAAIQVSSDQRLKTNIVDTEMNATEKLNQVRVVDFNWDDPSDTSFNNRNARGKWTGVLAQELVDVLPFAVNAPRNEEDLTIDAESDQKWLVDQAQMVPVLIKAIQELTARIAQLEGAN